MYLTALRVADAATRLSGTAREVFADFLILKREGLSAANSIEVTTASTQVSCDLLLRVTRGDGQPVIAGRPYFNPFKRRDSWLRDGYPRFGTYSNLDGQTLRRFISFPEGTPPREARLQADYVDTVARVTRYRAAEPTSIPLKEIAIWAGRAVSFPAGASLDTVVSWFVSEFKISPEEQTLFLPPGGEQLPFSDELEVDALANLLLERHPHAALPAAAGAHQNQVDDLPTDLIDAVRGPLVVPDLTVRQMATIVRLGNNLILTGPPGTGKSTLAVNLARAAAERAAEFGLPSCSGYLPTTATADWSTFDTIGGYVPADQGGLTFRPGMFLEAIETNRWLLVDELNRADADKAFGQLFTVLSGQEVELPFQVLGADGNRIRLRIKRDLETAQSYLDKGTGTYIIGRDWRIIATMNSFDRSQLFQLSAAFVRRFAAIHVPVPSPTELAEWVEDRGLQGWAVERFRLLLDALEAHRPLGPAILADVAAYVARRLEDDPELEASIAAEQLAAPAGDQGTDTVNDPLLEAIAAFILPQLDGLDATSLVNLRERFASILRPTSSRMLNRYFSDLFGV